MGHIPGAKDADLHNLNGEHRFSPATADGRVVAAHARRIRAHLDAHNEGPVTRRNSAAPFPESLQMVWNGHHASQSNMDLVTVDRHNRVVAEFARDVGWPRSGLQRGERAILSLAYGIEQWLASGGMGSDGILGPNVAYPLLDAFRAALDADNTGRLDCGTLCDWAECRMRELGFNPDSGAWL